MMNRQAGTAHRRSSFIVHHPLWPAMDWFWNLNLIHFFDFYLAVAFLLGVWTRFRQYQAILGLVREVPGRWPRLFQLVKQHRNIFLTWSTVGPGLLALGLMLVQALA